MWWWAVQRVEDRDIFEADLERPPGEVGPKVSEVELETDARSFMAFAKMMGVAPPRPVTALPSAHTADPEG